MREHLKEDAQFTISVSVPHVTGYEDDEDSELVLDGPIYDDDLALSPAVLLDGLNIAHEASSGGDEHVLSYDAHGDLEFRGGLDDELADADADGETDPELDENNGEVPYSMAPTAATVNDGSDRDDESDHTFWDAIMRLTGNWQWPVFEDRDTYNKQRERYANLCTLVIILHAKLRLHQICSSYRYPRVDVSV